MWLSPKLLVKEQPSLATKGAQLPGLQGTGVHDVCQGAIIITGILTSKMLASPELDIKLLHLHSHQLALLLLQRLLIGMHTKNTACVSGNTSRCEHLIISLCCRWSGCSGLSDCQVAGQVIQLPFVAAGPIWQGWWR